MVKWARRFLGLVIVLAAFSAMILIAKTQTAHAELQNQFPTISNGGSAWAFTSSSTNISPNPELTWQFTPPASAANKTGHTEHILRNNKNGRNKGTRLRVYYTQRPQSITVKVNVGYCELNANGAYAGDLIVRLGGTEVYKQATEGKTVTDYHKYWTWQPDDPANHPSYPYTLQRATSKDAYTSGNRNNSPACNAPLSNDYPIHNYKEKCSNLSPSGLRCAGNGSESFNITNGGSATVPADGGSFGSNYAVDNKLDNRALTITSNTGSISYDANTGLWFADLDIDLTASDDNNKTANEQQLDFKVTVDDATSATTGARMHALLGYRSVSEVDAAKYFGLQGNGQDDSSVDGYGQKFAIPFGMSCGDSRTRISPAPIIIYDPDTNTYGDSYALVLKRDATGNISRLTKNDYTLVQNAVWDGDRIKIHDLSNSKFTIDVDRGVNYMLVLVNPKTNSPPSHNIWSVYLPSDSINGLINCNYSLEPHLNNVQPAFSAYGDTLTPHGWITNKEASTTTGDHEWRITRAIFNSRPADLSRTTATNANNGEPICGFITRQSGPPVSCSNTYTGTYPADSDKVASDSLGTYPAGTYVCYVTSIFNPTLAIGDDTQWANSPMQCSVAGVKPKVRVTGNDLKTGGGIDTSLSSQAGNTFGSWGEYGVFSNGTNTNMASGSGLLGGGPNSQLFWSSLTFANTGVYGRYGGVLPPIFPGVGTPIGDTLSATTYGEGDKRVLQFNGTLYITGNLVYDNDGNDNDGYNSIKDLPEIKIIADNIVIAPNVTQIDPWLVVRSASGAYGKLSTCGGASGVDGFKPFNTAGLLTSGMCQNELKLNGLVAADQLYAYRTKDAAGDAWAENFDLRASNFLSSYAGINTARPVARTELITELPPRF